jgi:hypothetical protein
MTKIKNRYILKKVMEGGRGGGPKIPAWYVYDTETKQPSSSSSIVKSFAQDLCDSSNKMHLDATFEKEVLE